MNLSQKQVKYVKSNFCFHAAGVGGHDDTTTGKIHTAPSVARASRASSPNSGCVSKIVGNLDVGRSETAHI
jgi:hypothetical protein